MRSIAEVEHGRLNGFLCNPLAWLVSTSRFIGIDNRIRRSHKFDGRSKKSPSDRGQSPPA